MAVTSYLWTGGILSSDTTVTETLVPAIRLNDTLVGAELGTMIAFK